MVMRCYGATILRAPGSRVENKGNANASARKNSSKP